MVGVGREAVVPGVGPKGLIIVGRNHAPQVEQVFLTFLALVVGSVASHIAGALQTVVDIISMLV
jgi:hypothetical protein